MSTHKMPGGGFLSLEAIAAALAPFHVDLEEAQLLAIRNYVDLLLKWNKSMNLTAIEDGMEIVSRHFGESLFAATFLEIAHCRLADVGTGAGFPGLALKIAFPSTELVLFESNAKKCAFLTEVSQRLGLAGVGIMINRQRYEGFSTTGPKFDFVCARALGDYATFLPWARRVLEPGGRVVLWLGIEDSIRMGRRIGFRWHTPTAIPESRRRVILVGELAP